MASRHSLICHTCTCVRCKCCESSRSNLKLLWLFSMLLFSCRPATPPPSAADLTQMAATPVIETKAVSSTKIPDEVTELREAQYELGGSDALQVVQLTDGKFEQGIPGSDNFMSIVLTDFVAVGDLDADGKNEVAALVSENYGGSGVFVFLAVYAKVNGMLAFQTSTIVDDRPRLDALSIGNGELFLEAVIHGPDEPMCCPTWKTARHYRFADRQLDMTDYTTFTPDGRPRTITIESPRSGTEVFTSVQIKGKVEIAPFENNLAYRIYDVSDIELAAGSIAVSAPDLGAAGTFDTVVRLGKVLSGAVIRVEVQDLSAADGSLFAMDSVELVVK